MLGHGAFNVQAFKEVFKGYDEEEGNENRSPGARKLGYLEKLSNLTGPRASTTATCAAPAVPSAASAALRAASAAAERKLRAHLACHGER